MIRIEIIGNVELLDELTEKFLEEMPQQYYSIMPMMRGFGKKGYASGDSVWPESNFYCLILIDDAGDDTDDDFVNSETNDKKNPVHILKTICDDIQKGAPKNSITFFASKVVSML